jgi:RND superfamily putative drug exporter
VVAAPVLWVAPPRWRWLRWPSPPSACGWLDPGCMTCPPASPWSATCWRSSTPSPRGPAPAESSSPGKDLSGQPVRQAVAALQEAAQGRARPLREPVTATLLGHGRVLVSRSRWPAAAPNRTSISALETLRDHALPATLGKVGGISYAVAGNTASTHDFLGRMHSRGAVVFAFVLRAGLPAAAAVTFRSSRSR